MGDDDPEPLVIEGVEVDAEPLDGPGELLREHAEAADRGWAEQEGLRS